MSRPARVLPDALVQNHDDSEDPACLVGLCDRRALVRRPYCLHHVDRAKAELPRGRRMLLTIQWAELFGSPDDFLVPRIVNASQVTAGDLMNDSGAVWERWPATEMWFGPH